jgi:hypothetical protein
MYTVVKTSHSAARPIVLSRLDTLRTISCSQSKIRISGAFGARDCWKWLHTGRWKAGVGRLEWAEDNMEATLRNEGRLLDDD